jgi:redox-sensitive bicupin YhaK (pirin superfamily)
VDDRRAGILHIEAPPEHLVVSGGLFHGFQLWVNLPRTDKLKPPAYQDLRSSEVGLLTSADGGSLLRVIAARSRGSPARVDPHPDGDGPRDGGAGRLPRAALEPRLQRPGLRHER